MTPSKIAIAQAAMQDPKNSISHITREIGVSRTTLYNYCKIKAI